MVQCTDDDNVHKVCVFKNLVLYQGEILYIVEYPDEAKSIEMPDPTVFDLEAETLSIVDYAVPNIVHPITMESLKSRISSSAGKKNINVAHYKLAMFQRVRSLTNWYWAMNSISNTFHRLCDQLGACTQEKVHEVALLQPATYSTTQRDRKNAHLAIRTGQHSSASDELKGCLGPMFWVDHPRMHDAREWVGDELVMLDSVHFGVGKSVIQPNVALEIDGEFAFEPSSIKTGQKRVEFLRKCASLPPVPPIEDTPSVVLINRPFADGRSIIGLDDVYDRLKRTLPPHVDLTLHFPRGGSGLHDQASTFAKASVLVIPHGAATANFAFLPLDAVVLDVHALHKKFQHDSGIVNSLPSPPYNVTILPIDCASRTEPHSTAFSELPAWNKLTSAEQAELLSPATVNQDLVRRLKELLGFSVIDWLDLRAYHPDAEELTQAIIDAVSLWESKVKIRKSKMMKDKPKEN